MSATSSPLRLFLGELAKCPRQMGSVWPSSPALAAAMARWLPACPVEPILELGPGTGIVTEKLLAAGLPEERLVVVEKSPALAEFLRGRFPRARVILGDALELERVVAGEKFGAVFSSLPLKVFTADEVARLSAAIHAVLLPGAPWVQYSYQLVNGHAPSPAFLPAQSHIVWQNLPPAKVTVYRRAGDPVGFSPLTRE